MPQASSELQNKFPGMETEAWQILSKAGFADDRGIIRPPKRHVLTPREFDAVSYLCDEWDYAFDGVLS